jgi:hypothetical protein
MPLARSTRATITFCLGQSRPFERPPRSPHSDQIAALRRSCGESKVYCACELPARDGAESGVSSIATKNFVHFVALKCFDVLKRLHVRQALRGRTVTEFEFIQLAAFAEVECANFIDAAWEMSDDLLRRGEANGIQQTD